MLVYLAGRLLWTIPVLLGVSLIAFLLMHLVPGGPWDMEKPLASEVVENLNRKYGLDKPVWLQYPVFLGNILRGDLGVSYTYQDRGVAEIILSGLPATATLGLLAFLFSVLVGPPLGVLAAVRQNSWVDYVSVGLATVFASIPGFVLGLVLILVFAVGLRFLPTGGWGTVEQVLLPALALGALPAAYNARIVRASVLDVLRQDYIRTARAKGLSETMVHSRHVLRNALIPLLTVLGPELAALVTGSFIIETLFSIPGVGRLFVQAVFARDYALIMGSVLFYALVIALLNLIVDILYGIVDPRTRS